MKWILLSCCKRVTVVPSCAKGDFFYKFEVLCAIYNISHHVIKKNSYFQVYLFYCYFGEKCLKITQNRAYGIQKQLQKKENISDKISQKFI